MSEEGEALKFPLACQFRIIAERQEGTQEKLGRALLKLGVRSPIVEQNQSKTGRYQSFSVDVYVHSMEMMNQIDQALRAVPGVRMVL